MMIEFSFKVAQEATYAINDNPFLECNLEQTSSTSFEFDEEFLDEVINALDFWGIDENEYGVTTL